MSRSLEMSMTRPCICPVVVTKGSDQAPVSTRFAERDDIGVVSNYGSAFAALWRVLVCLANAVTDLRCHRVCWWSQHCWWTCAR